VVVDGLVLVTAPDQVIAQQVSRAVAGLDVEQVTEPDVIASVLPVADVLGPAWLSYLDPAVSPSPTLAVGDLQHLPAHDSALCRLYEAVSEDDLQESGLEDVTSPVFAIFEDGVVSSAAGYQLWTHQVAHLTVLTAAAARGRGLATTVAAAAVADAVTHGLLPQWRARPAASRSVAARLGFKQVGCQLSFRLDGLVP